MDQKIDETLTLPYWKSLWNEKYIQLTQESNIGSTVRVEKGNNRVIKAKGMKNYVNDNMIKWVVKILMEAKKRYYYTGDILMEDSAYDWLESNLKILDPDNIFLEKVGY